ncbi:MAG: cation:proton antiporter [Rhodospirillaceae bacterium]|nr:cation:proton antiporter [Rhodospirillales bacterium]
MMTNHELSVFFIALVSLLLTAHLAGAAAERMRLPRVVGEIMAGFLLGPSVLGSVWPVAQTWLFNSFPGEQKVLGGMYWLGLALLMFVSGFKVQAESFGRDRRLLGPVVLCAIVIPGAAAFAIVQLFDLSALAGPAGTTVSFQLVFAIAAAVTSIPVISRIFMDIGIMESRFACVVLAASTFEDILLWMMLSVATALAREAVTDWSVIVRSAVLSFLFLGISVGLGPTIVRLLKAAGLGGDRLAAPAVVLSVCFIFAALASLLDVNVVFGALVAGMVVGRGTGPGMVAVRKEVSSIAMGLFVPIYFALVGMRIDMGAGVDVWGALVFLFGSSLVKIVSVWLGGSFAGLTRRSALDLGVAMNTRGGPGIVLASVALEFGIISPSFFTTLIFAAIVTSAASGVWLRRAAAGNSDLLSIRAVKGNFCP